MTSGQHLGPMPSEVAYAAAKAALEGVTVTLADQLANRGIRLNTVNPGPVDTGYLTEDMWRTVAPMFPSGRYGEPDDPARLITWLVTDEARWITGQVINTEGGFGRWRPRGA
ncbi:SDR family oxidoreductase [Actinomadura sp. WMMB 499]|nr:SDR family oxidoreductase [Actinomadura sp. WMMB 499]